MHAKCGKPTDGELVRRALEGDLAAFDALVAQHRESVLRVTRGVLGDWEEAADAAQEALMEALDSLRGLREAEKFAPWLAIIARRCATRHLNRAASGPDFVPFSEAVILPLAPPEPPLATGSAMQHVRRALRELSVRHRQVVTLHYLDGLSLKQIGSRLDLPVGTVKRVLHESRNSLRKEMEVMPKPRRTVGAPKGLAWWINGDVGPGDVLRGLLPQAICLAVNKKARTARQIADEVDAHVDYVREAIGPLVEEAVLTATANGRYRANFLALGATDWLDLTEVVRTSGPQVAEALEGQLPRLESAWAETMQADKGFAWAEGIWPALALFVGNMAVSRRAPSGPEPPVRASGRRYCLGGHEEVPKQKLVWTTGFNNWPSSEGTLSYGWFWTWGLPRKAMGFTDRQRSVLTVLAKGVSRISQVEGETGLKPGETSDAITELIEVGVVLRHGSKLALSFPVFGEQDSAVLTPLCDEVAAELLASALLPAVKGVESQLQRTGYGRLREQFPEWSRWQLGCMIGEGLRHLMKQGILPPPPSPAPVNFCLIGWFGQRSLLEWGPDD